MTDEKKPGLDIVMSSSAGDIEMLGKLTGREFGHSVNKFPIRKPPDQIGPAGKAWLCDHPAGLAKMKIRPEDDATVCHWMVEAPSYHPVWHSYSIMCVHLRPMPDDRPTKKYFEEATHEMWVFACNPEMDLNEMVERGIPAGNWLSPINFGAQFLELTDDLAADRIRRTVAEVVNGQLSPDTDHQMEWRRRFGSSMVKEEYR